MGSRARTSEEKNFRNVRVSAMAAHIWVGGGAQVVQPEGSPTFSPEEFEERLQALSEADILRLEMIAQYRAKCCGLSPKQLIQEAVTRVLEGSRHCPKHVKVVPFLAQVMRSLSSGEYKAQNRKPEFVSLSSLTEAGFDPPDPSATPEEQWLSRQHFKKLWEKIRVIFSDDAISLDILEYLTEGYEAEEIRKDLGLDQTTYDSKRRFIRRRLDRHFRKEGGV
jgi:RNA polymerase sigma-70 factor (ECF subfamily)